MMSCNSVTAGQAGTYFEHGKDYYTNNMTNYDRWHGSLAESRGLSGECSKEQFDEILEHIQENGRTKRAGLDCTFSAPKSVSLAMAKDEQTREDMIKAHQAAVAKIAEKIEVEYLRTRSEGQTIFSRNMIAAEFLHTMARPTKENGMIPDLDLHSHLVILNDTFADGKSLSCDYGKITKERMIKQLGLEYRQAMAQELQAKGYELEITDSRNGFYELKGFDRETILEYSSRRREMLELAEEHGIKDMQKANQFSREKKEVGKANFEEVCQETKKSLYESGRVNIERKESAEDGRKKPNENSRERSGERDIISSRGQSDITSFERIERSGELAIFADRPSLQELPEFHVDSTSTRRDNLLLPEGRVSRLAKLQSEKVRSHYMLREATRERLEQIDKTTSETIKKLSAEKYAFSLPEARARIMSAGVLEGITEHEAKAAIERAGLVNLGRMERGGKDVYLTTETNIEKERANIERMKAGKGEIKSHILTMDESRAALERAEGRARAQGLESAAFSIADGSGEQAAAVHHVLTCQDKYVAVDGLAGTGKTTMMERMKWIADEQGIEIKGVCFTGKAADGLQAESGIESQTIHAFLNKLEGRGAATADAPQGEIKQEWNFENVQKASGREIWAVDEAGLVDMNLMNELQKAAEARGAQVLLLGDPDQLPPVGAGEPLRQMEKEGMATAHLTDIRRQKDTELLRAVRESVKGDHLITYEKLDKAGNYREVVSKTERHGEIRQEMTAAPIGEYRKNLLLVSTNADRNAYNKEIRAEYVKRGELEEGKKYAVTVRDGDKERTESRNFAKGDRIIFTANDNKIGAKNGTMAQIERIDGDRITATTDAGKRIEWDMSKYNSVDHSYAVTNYKAQGMTVDKVVVDMNTKGTAQSRNALYVDISRARREAVVYTDNKAKLERQTRHFAHKVTSKDFSRRIETMRAQGGVKNNDRYHAPDVDRRAALEKALKQIKEHTLERPASIVAKEKAAEERAKQAAAEQAKAAAKTKAAPQPSQEAEIETVYSR